MSQENVEIVRESIEAYNRRDFDTAVQSFDTETEWLLPPVLAAESRRGPEEIRRLWDTWIVSREAAKWREIEAIKHPLTGAKYGQLPT